MVESNNPTIKLKSGLNFIKISTDKSCQGTYSEEFFISEKVEYYPNPTINSVYFYIHGEDEFVDITVVDATGNLYKNCVEEIPSSRKIELNFGDFYKGVYVVRLKGKTLDKTIKIIKEQIQKIHFVHINNYPFKYYRILCGGGSDSGDENLIAPLQ